MKATQWWENEEGAHPLSFLPSKESRMRGMSDAAESGTYPSLCCAATYASYSSMRYVRLSSPLLHSRKSTYVWQIGCEESVVSSYAISAFFAPDPNQSFSRLHSRGCKSQWHVCRHC